MMRSNVGADTRLDARDYGGLALLTLYVSIVGSIFLAKVVDGSRLDFNSHGSGTIAQSSNTGGIVGAGLMVGAAGLATFAVLTQSGQRTKISFFSASLATLAIWWACSYLGLQANAIDGQHLVTAVSALLIISGVLISPIKPSSIRCLNNARDLTTVTMLAYSLIFPATGQLPCRTDKCGLFGSLFTGFVVQENAAAAMAILLLPLAVATVSRRRRLLSVLIATVFVIATGSRTALVGTVILSLFVMCYNKSNSSSTRGPSIFVRLLPIVGLLISTYLLIFASRGSFTGRGLLYEGIRNQLHGLALIVGSGPDTMARVGQAIGGFVVIGEHGQAPYLLALTGLVGYLLFFGATCSFLFRAEWTVRQFAAFGLVLASSVQGVTEPAWTFDVRTVGFLGMAIAISLMCAPQHHDVEPPTPGTASRTSDISAL